VAALVGQDLRDWDDVGMGARMAPCVHKKRGVPAMAPVALVL